MNRTGKIAIGLVGAVVLVVVLFLLFEYVVPSLLPANI